ncbi:hypothetical protein [Amycolatopsis acidiphila]|uniref:Uncharacterized protein n=2 Tax=Amycolatopsis acidiphila TaxID=715473 RepID=A0A558AL03_9PSEU|nr:hypothetical protein [Amycolatopsis acidiphila]TVT24949.1 hypothetical protein FNH06_03740 [Amycolatopsis acidiphila]
MNPSVVTAAACPLRGRLGETRYAHLHPTGERAVEAALLISRGRDQVALFCRYFRVFGLWPESSGRLSDVVLAQLAGELGECLRENEVLADETMRMVSRDLGATFAAQDGGPVVAREGAEAAAFVLRNWGPVEAVTR